MTPVRQTITMLLGAACLLCAGCDRRPTGKVTGVGAQAAALRDGSPPFSHAPSPRPAAVAPTATTEAAQLVWPPGPLNITFDDIKFEMGKDERFERAMLTQRIGLLQGRDVRIRGYILPSFQQRGITQFVLVRDNMECCFGPGAALYDCILVEMESGKSTSFRVRPVVVDGTFSIRELKGPDGKHLVIYHLTGRDVR